VIENPPDAHFQVAENADHKHFDRRSCIGLSDVEATRRSVLVMESEY